MDRPLPRRGGGNERLFLDEEKRVAVGIGPPGCLRAPRHGFDGFDVDAAPNEGRVGPIDIGRVHVGLVDAGTGALRVFTGGAEHELGRRARRRDGDEAVTLTDRIVMTFPPAQLVDVEIDGGVLVGDDDRGRVNMRDHDAPPG